MERKIGEIFEYNGEWYQCVGGTCRNCSFYYDTVCKNITTIGSTNFGNCHCSLRTDHKSVIFKKLEKVGEPFTCNYYGDNRLLTIQEYQAYDINISSINNIPMYVSNYKHKRIAIELKQNQENMEEKKSNLKPFSLEAAKAGKPVCTRDGRKARIICFDAKDTQPIIGLYEKNIDGIVREYLCSYHTDGRMYDDQDTGYDLMMLPEKKEGWIIKPKDYQVYQNKEDAERICNKDYQVIAKISWEE